MKLYLPDYDEKLFIQLDTSKTLRTFTLFNKLPLELRLSIWRATFPALEPSDSATSKDPTLQFA
ncbi:hypothetical protein IFR05_006140 [Cadophora sp. M221]|nr:hypothetical protein IFR05_006140 [Cadophora sp. M221]